MIWVFLGFLVIVLAVVILYYIGKRVTEQQKKFEQMFNQEKVKKDLDKYKRKQTPKVPKIKK